LNLIQIPTFEEMANSPVPSNGSLINKGKLTYFGSPIFHQGGVGFAFSALFSNNALVLGPPTQQATSKIVVDLMREVEIGAMVVVPSLLESVCKDHGKQFVEYANQLEYLFWIGGKLSRAFRKVTEPGTSVTYALF
jgi:hypothetical protein